MNTGPSSRQTRRRTSRGPDAERGGAPADARDAACRELERQAGRFPDLPPGALDTSRLERRDAALAHTIYDAAVRRWITLSRIIEFAGGRRMGELEPAVRAALLAGAVQLLLLDRVPDHAAIGETVEWVKGGPSRKAAGLVNAVLRKVAALRGERCDRWGSGRDEIPLADGTALGLCAPVLPEPERARLAGAVSLPVAVLDRWESAWGADRARFLAVHTLARAPVVLDVGYAERSVDDEPGLAPHDSDQHRVFVGADGDLVPLLDRRRDIWVQDASSGASVRAAASLSPSVVIDFCAGQGTKTRQLAAQFPGAEILASDVDTRRLATLRREFESHDRVRVVSSAELLDAGLGRGELVLLDVPCSNSGVLPRRPEARYRLGTDQIARIGEIQRQILADSIRLLAPGGTILYATCSLETEENEAVSAWAADRHGFKVESESRSWPGGIPGDEPASYRDGSYAALLTR